MPAVIEAGMKGVVQKQKKEKGFKAGKRGWPYTAEVVVGWATREGGSTPGTEGAAAAGGVALSAVEITPEEDTVTLTDIKIKIKNVNDLHFGWQAREKSHIPGCSWRLPSCSFCERAGLSGSNCRYHVAGH
jgi:hypothetical protein